MDQWLKKHRFAISITAFLLMLLPPLGMILAARHDAQGWIWGLLVAVVAGNLIALGVK
jgi:hypothetical protein